MQLTELYHKIDKMYWSQGDRDLIVSVPPNCYGKADIIYFDMHGSPPKGSAIYAKSWRTIYYVKPVTFSARSMTRNENIPEVDKLGVGFYKYHPDRGLEKLTVE